MSTFALIGLGSNVGDREATLGRAVAALGRLPGTRLHSFSRHHTTAPVGGPGGQGEFLNAAALLRTSLSARDLLGSLHEIERSEGRERIVHWGERTLDLDLLLHGDSVIDEADLVVPHPRMSVRRFVLAPAVEIAPRLVDPLTGRTLDRLLANLDRRPTQISILAPPGPPTASLIEALAGHFGSSLVRGPSCGIDSGETLATEADESRFRSAFDDFLEGNRIESTPEPIGGASLLLNLAWYDQFAVIAQRRYASNPCRLLPFLDAWKRGRAFLRAPTFVIFWDPPWPGPGENLEGRSAEGWLGLAPAYRSHLASRLRTDPVLHVRSPRLGDAVEEAVAAFAASRG
ncbi:2-amino-4-hydroxy-6-hydroxymethyldihydropteridine diphosphokinase [Isosphaeraceae bacterium EP7]